MNAWDVLALIGAAVAVVAYALRLNLLTAKDHRISVIVFHVALGGAAFAAGLNAWQGQTCLLSACAIVASLMWVFVSLPSWKNGPPAHTMRVKPLPREHWRHVHGGKQ